MLEPVAAKAKPAAAGGEIGVMLRQSPRVGRARRGAIPDSRPGRQIAPAPLRRSRTLQRSIL